MKRILLIAFIVLNCIGLVYAQDDDSVLDFILEHPDDVAIYCVNENDPDNNVLHNVDERFPLASTYKVVVLAEVARQYDIGLLDFDESIPVDDLNVYWSPYLDGGAHQQWLESTEIDEDGNVTLRDVAYGMIAFSSNANTDYLIRRLGAENFVELYDLLGLENTDLPESTYLGLMLMRGNQETGAFDITNPDMLDDDALFAEMRRLEDAFTASEEWREDYNNYLLDYSGELSDLLQTQADYYGEYGPRASASDIVSVLTAIYDENVFSADATQFLDDILGGIFDTNPDNQEVYEIIATKGGSLSGILTSVWYVDPVGLSPYNVAIFYRNIPTDLWLEWQTTGAQQLLELRVFAYGEGCALFSVDD